NGGFNFLQVSVVGGSPTGGKVKFDKGQFLSTADISGEWEGNEEGSHGKANIELNGLDNMLTDIISTVDFTGLSGYALNGAYDIEEIYISQELLGQVKINVEMTVMGEHVDVVYTPINPYEGYYNTAQANQDLTIAVADAIGRVVANKTGLAMLSTLMTEGLAVIGLRNEAQFVFNAAGQAVDAAGNVLNATGDVIGSVLGGAGDVFCGIFGC
ncbi:MAG: hypothetical protein HRT35_16865, partial [Algicola sp.]|nr:hypothetical protein [Algicola sp.]